MFDGKIGFDRKNGKAIGVGFSMLYFAVLGSLVIGGVILLNECLKKSADSTRAMDIEMERIEKNRQRARLKR